MGTDRYLDAGTLQEHTRALKALARCLVSDDARADDLVQETWLRWVEQPPRGVTPSAAWLFRVLRNFAYRSFREERNRSERERRAARPVAVPETTARALERAELHRQMVECVLGLEEPYRSVIVLTFFEGMKPREIAAAEAVDVTTVRRRLRRATELLRAKLDRLHDADPSRWRTLLAVVASAGTAGKVARSGEAGGVSAGTASSVVLGGWMMKKAALLTFSIVAIVVGVFTVSEWSGPEAPREVRQAATTREHRPDPVHPEEASPLEQTGPPASVARRLTVEGWAYEEGKDRGISGVTMVLRELGTTRPLELQVDTSTEGRYRFENLSTGDYEIDCSEVPPGYRRPESADRSVSVSLVRGQSVDRVDFVIRAEVPLAGTVVDQEQRPVAGAAVQLLTGGGQDLLGEVETTREGTFRFHRLGPLEDYCLVAEKGGHRARTLDSRLPAEGKTDEVVLLRVGSGASSVSGTVVDAGGRPLGGMDVLAQHGEPGFFGHFFAGFDRTDDDGSFLLRGLLPGSYRLIANPVGLSVLRHEDFRLDVFRSEHVTDVLLVYDRTCTIAGSVIDEIGEPIVGARVGATDIDTKTVKTDAEGRFELSRLAPRAYTVRVVAEGFHQAKITAVPGCSEGVEFVLRPNRFELSGRVVRADTAEPLPRFELAWGPWSEIWGDAHLDSRRLPLNFQLHTSPDGRFRLFVEQRVVSARKVIIAARAEGFGAALEIVELERPRQFDNLLLRLDPGGTLQGTVVDALGAPVPEARIFYGNAVSNPTAAAPAITGEGGHFVLENVPQVEQSLAVYHPEYAVRTVVVGAKRDREDEVEIVLTRGGSVTGRVLDVPEGVRAELFIGERRVVPEPDGRYSFDLLPPGTTTLTLRLEYDDRPVDHSGRDLEREVEIENGKTLRLDFRMPPARGRIGGRVSLDAPTPESVLVRARVDTTGGAETHFTLAEADGLYELLHVPSGEVRLELHVEFQDGTEEKHRTTLYLGEGQSITHDFDL